jgi:hypothetical protein
LAANKLERFISIRLKDHQTTMSKTMNNSNKYETREKHTQADSHTDIPSYENLEDELINLYPKLDLLNSQIAELQVTISSMCQSCDIKNECEQKVAVDEAHEKIQYKNLTRLSVIALETAQIVARLRKDNEKVVILEHAVASVKIIDDYAQRTE